jgi:hypothetical protein
MRLDEKEKALLRDAFDCSRGEEMTVYLHVVQAVRPWLRPQIGWRKFGKLRTEELLDAFFSGPPTSP